MNHLKNTLIIACIITPMGANANEVLGGIEGLACEAILCLSSSVGSSIGECNPSLSYYYDLKSKKFSDTIKKRLNFLNQCPAGSQTPSMRSLVSAIANGAGRCDAASLNATLLQWGGFGKPSCISSVKPSYCTAYTGHEYTDLSNGAKYVVTPKTNNYWPYQNAFSGNSNGISGLLTNSYGNNDNSSCGKWVD